MSAVKKSQLYHMLGVAVGLIAIAALVTATVGCGYGHPAVKWVPAPMPVAVSENANKVQTEVDRALVPETQKAIQEEVQTAIHDEVKNEIHPYVKSAVENSMYNQTAPQTQPMQQSTQPSVPAGTPVIIQPQKPAI